MFSGIVQAVGLVNFVRHHRVIKLSIYSHHLADCDVGNSVCINGVCLTVISIDKSNNLLEFEVVPESIRKTTLSYLVKGSKVNLELPLRVNGFIGGHLVQGHVDGIGKIKSIRCEGKSKLITISTSQDILRYLTKKGFVTMDGMSITIIDVYEECFLVTLIPHTISVTIAKDYHTGSKINLEADPIGKHIYHYMEKIQHVPKS